MIEGHTRVVGKSQGYVPLAIRDEKVMDVTTGREVNQMTTAWELTEREIFALKAGRPLLVSIFGNGWPPILIQVRGEEGEKPPVTTPAVPPPMANRTAMAILAELIALAGTFAGKSTEFADALRAILDAGVIEAVDGSGFELGTKASAELVRVTLGKQGEAMARLIEELKP